MTEEVGEIQTDRAMRGIARECVVLADASKLDRVAPGFMFGFDQVGTLVTDGRIRPAMRSALGERGLTVVVAPSADLSTGTAGAQGTESYREPSP
jgi:DeoR/GlpR family transcriptional regulator of sugar metabolism